MNKLRKQAEVLHRHVPPDWYESSIKINGLQRFWHGRRAREIRRFATPVSGPVLDIGCADGYFSNIILSSTRAKRLVGIDVLRASVTYAKKRYRYNKKMSYIVADAHRLPYGRHSFDAVFSIESLEHLLLPEKALGEMYRVLKRNGYVLILIPSENRLFKIIWSLWTRGRGRIWKDSHVHVFHPSALQGMLTQAKFKNIQTRRFLFSMLLLVKAYK